MNANDIIEKCARVCDRMVTEHETLGFHAAADIYKNSALQIRALKSTPCLKGGDANEPASALSKTGLDKSSPGVKAGACPAETVSEAMVEQARLIIANEIKCNGFVKSSGLCVRGTLEKHCDCREASRQILALAPAGDGWRSEDMPPPDRVIHYNDGMSAPAMFHYSTENCDARTIAREAGFEISFVTMESELGDGHPLMKAYVDGGEMSSVLNLWNPVVHDGWKLGGKTDSEDGPVALLLRPIPAPPKDGRE